MPISSRRGLFPDIQPYRSGMLAVSDPHRIYFEECGNPQRQAGGHGAWRTGRRLQSRPCAASTTRRATASSCSTSAAAAARRRTPRWRTTPPGISSPTWSGCATHLGLERWQLCGGSWGSTLALAYAETHPERVSELILRGIFLLRRAELHWFYQEGCSWIFPDAFDEYLQADPAGGARRHDRRLSSPSDRAGPQRFSSRRRAPGASGRARRCRCCTIRSASAGSASTTTPSPSRGSRRIISSTRASSGRTTSCCANADAIRQIPGVIVHGRYDVVTPLRSAWDLKRAWPEADLRIVPDAGHAMTEPGIIHEIVEASDGFARLS